MIRKIVALTGIAVTALTFFAVPANAASSSETVQADLDGDRHLDTVVTQVNPANPAEQLLTATIRGRSHHATAPVDEYHGVLPMRVADINDDGRDEIILTEFAGASTLNF